MSSTNETKSQIFSQNEFRKFLLVYKSDHTHNVRTYRFKLPENQIFTLPVASCIILRGTYQGKEFCRPYTPVTQQNTVGHFDLVIKVYEQGNLSRYIDSLVPGEDYIDVKGPFTKIQYPFNKRAIGMLAGGTGITPMLQVIEEILRHPNDKTEISLIFANNTIEDIILREYIESLAEKHDNFRVHFVVASLDKDKDGDKTNWKGSIGYINEEILKQNLGSCYPPQEDSMVFVCGPPPFMNAMSGDKVSPKDQGELIGLLKKLNYSSDMVFKF